MNLKELQGNISSNSSGNNWKFFEHIRPVRFIWNNEARCIQINGEKVFFMKPQGLVAQDIRTKSLQQLYNCHNKVISQVQAKLMFSNKLGAQINVRPRKGF